ncbi:hypothetical protein C8J56DRAFT_834683, partial [Mycena floridula]
MTKASVLCQARPMKQSTIKAHPSENTPQTRPQVPDPMEIELRWQRLIPSLVPAYIAFTNTSKGLPLPRPSDIKSSCRHAECPRKTREVDCKYLDCDVSIDVTYCRCQGLSLVLVQNGLFPATPTAPRTAFSTALLDFSKILGGERSCHSITSFSSAMKTFYNGRGFSSTHNNVSS